MGLSQRLRKRCREIYGSAKEMQGDIWAQERDAGRYLGLRKRCREIYGPEKDMLGELQYRPEKDM